MLIQLKIYSEHFKNIQQPEKIYELLFSIVEITFI